MIRVTQAIPQPDFSLRLTFSNGEQRRFDVQPYLGKGVFAKLKDINFFSRVRVVGGTVEWPDQIDLCPDTLYEKSELLQVTEQPAHLTPQGPRKPGSALGQVLVFANDSDSIPTDMADYS
ncbi:MAG: DUF2442 domain-containing protein [Betaproteobacteria bacterium]|nr:DUF2442 domain-containing protein [Betaproteobacteria bacterium]